ncbi:sensor histidine kinase [Bacillus sp. B1-b2]|uniref:sensor histidine kinase n=1 Tax=Bacillus sp. B1-b2 TaxID=2653201 RepID=UPI0012621947|nr:GHKL domain-containing protein [Bacillus sp. B1-b2]KAB7670740.1 GHKL domain-containing protein [Bacillus sp. B1-b2]
MPIIILVLVIMLQILFTCLFIVSTVVFKDEPYILGIPVHLIFVVLLSILSLILLGKIYQRDTERKIKQTESIHEEQFRSLVASVRSDRHDLNNHLTVISGLLAINNYEALSDYIKNLIGDTRINNQVLAIKDPVLASLLYSIMENFKKKEVIFNFIVSTEEVVRLLTSTDLIRIISNLLDNALDATLELSEEKRYVCLELLERSDNLAIIVKNTSILKNFSTTFMEAGYSTKSQQSERRRGFGLSIIQELTKKYHGDLHIYIEEELVHFELLFPKP